MDARAWQQPRRLSPDSESGFGRPGAFCGNTGCRDGRRGQQLIGVRGVAIFVSFGAVYRAHGQQVRSYESPMQIAGMPRLSVGRTAHGIIAGGGVATGIVAIGGVTARVVAFGATSVGVFSVGALSVGISVLAAVAIGGRAVGALALGDATLGVLAIGRYA